MIKKRGIEWRGLVILENFVDTFGGFLSDGTFEIMVYLSDGVEYFLSLDTVRRIVEFRAKILEVFARIFIRTIEDFHDFRILRVRAVFHLDSVLHRERVALFTGAEILRLHATEIRAEIRVDYRGIEKIGKALRSFGYRYAVFHGLVREVLRFDF